MKILGLLLVASGAITAGSMTFGVVSGMSPLSKWAAADIVLGAVTVIIGVMMIAHTRNSHRNFYIEEE